MNKKRIKTNNNNVIYYVMVTNYKDGEGEGEGDEYMS